MPLSNESLYGADPTANDAYYQALQAYRLGSPNPLGPGGSPSGNPATSSPYLSGGGQGPAPNPYQPPDLTAPTPAPTAPTTSAPTPGNPSYPATGAYLASLKPGQTVGSLSAYSANGPTITNPQDPGQITAWLQWRAYQTGADPILKTPQGISYYEKAILDNGGLTDTKYWTNKSTLAAFGGAVGAGGNQGSGTGGGGSGSIPLPGTVQNSPQMEQLISMLMSRANEPIPTLNDPIVRAQTDAFNAQEQRGVKNFESAEAERAGPVANTDASRLAATESGAQASATFAGQVLQSQLTQRAADINAALSGLQGVLTAQQQLQLSEELARINAALAEAQLNQQGYQFDVTQQDRVAGI